MLSYDARSIPMEILHPSVAEPTVCPPEGASRCFMQAQFDVLVLESHLIVKQMGAVVGVAAQAVIGST